MALLGASGFAGQTKRSSRRLTQRRASLLHDDCRSLGDTAAVRDAATQSNRRGRHGGLRVCGHESSTRPLFTRELPFLRSTGERLALVESSPPPRTSGAHQHEASLGTSAPTITMAAPVTKSESATCSASVVSRRSGRPWRGGEALGCRASPMLVPSSRLLRACRARARPNSAGGAIPTEPRRC
jgi:hypothetical protein